MSNPPFRSFYRVLGQSTLTLRAVGVLTALAYLPAQPPNAYGVRGAVAFYQYRTPYAQFLARLGAEVGATGRIFLAQSRKSRLYHGLMPGFGYLMGHSRLVLDSSLYISPLSGRPLAGLASAHTYTHYLYLQGLWYIAFDQEANLAVAAGPQVLRPFGQSLMLEYETPDGQPIQEWNRVSLTDLHRVIPPWIFNLALYAELRMRVGLHSEAFLYLQTLHQLNRYLWPTGLLAGLTWRWKSRPTN